ncbi:MAG: hypothetical protein KDH89_08135 [Anaerolineae bacterium]|nr:hypothetical protein [Anaerolineae bacterium]
MRILAIITGDYGRRHAGNVREHAPEGWTLTEWLAPTNLPLFIDYPEDYVPADLPQADLVLAFQEHKGVAELIPDVCAVTGAKAVIAPVDSEAWLPRGLARQLRGWLADDGVACVTPKPLCSLTERDYLVTRRQRERYDNPLIAEFACYFGRPNLRITVDPDTRLVTEAAVLRDAACGCARHVATGLAGVSADDAEFEAGMLHHHFPCLASMGIDPDFSDTLMHVSGNLLRDNVAEQVKPFKQVTRIRPSS